MKSFFTLILSLSILSPLFSQVELEDMTPERPPEMAMLTSTDNGIIIGLSYDWEPFMANMGFYLFNEEEGIEKLNDIIRMTYQPNLRSFIPGSKEGQIFAGWIANGKKTIESATQNIYFENVNIPIDVWENALIFLSEDDIYLYSTDGGVTSDTLPQRYIPRFINDDGIVASDQQNSNKAVLLNNLPPFDKKEDYGDITINDQFVIKEYMGERFFKIGNSIYVDVIEGPIPVFTPDSSFTNYDDFVINGDESQPLGDIYLIDNEFGIVYNIEEEVVYDYSTVIEEPSITRNTHFAQWNGYVYMYIPGIGLHKTTDFTDIKFLGRVPVMKDDAEPFDLELHSTGDDLYITDLEQHLYILDEKSIHFTDLLNHDIKEKQIPGSEIPYKGIHRSSEMRFLSVIGISGGYTYISGHDNQLCSARELYIVDNESKHIESYFVNDFNSGNEVLFKTGDGYIYSDYPNHLFNNPNWFGLVRHGAGVYDSLDISHLPELQASKFYTYPNPVEYQNHLFLLGRMAELGADTLDFSQAIRVEYEGAVREDIHIREMEESEERLFAIDSAGARYVFDDAEMIFRPIEEGSGIKHPADRLQIRNSNEISIDYGETFTELTQLTEVNQIATVGSRVFVAAEDWKKIYEVMNIGSILAVGDEGMLYPNPSASGHFQSKEPLGAAKIYDISGRPVEAIISGNSFDISNNPAGIYFLVTESGERYTLVRE